MFICTVRANTLKFFCVIAASLVVLCAIILMIPEYTPVSTKPIAAAAAQYNYDKIKTNDNIVEFLAQFGWEVDSEPLEEVTIKIPAEFDKVMNSYNELQRNQGLDLSKYRGREVKRYTYKVKNFPDYTGTVMANVIIYKNRVIGGDLCSSDVTGFICGFEGKK
ncbi:MAG: DUF4830 domain-containing protein [Clostridia bacterium]|nr:DUF4830 domain-containing protein [Clostridia bacterium]MBQ9995495.1 DUF4830 domain-containing protein [Clostridia bacterium]